MSNNKHIKVIIAGGGTGGHIFPAIAIANQLKAINSGNEILFIGAQDRMEMEKVPAAGYKIIGLWISGLERKLSAKNLKFPLKVISSIRRCLKIMKDFKPDVVVGVGGYSSGPAVYAATLKGIPTLVQEQNSYAGITNKLLGKRVNKICVAYDKMDRFFPKDKIIYTGNPVRDIILQINKVDRTKAYTKFGLNPAKKTILAIGGSLGARTINQSIAQHIDLLDKVQIIWQTGKNYYHQAQEALEGKEHIKVFEFIADMDLAYAVADVIISRAGAISVSELSIVGKPVILVPSPNVAEDHQTKNAMSLVEKNAAVLVKDKDAFNNLIKEVLQLLKDDTKQKEFSENITQLAQPNATKNIVEQILSLT